LAPGYRCSTTESDLQAKGIDFSTQMPAKACATVESRFLSHILKLRQMDARAPNFPGSVFNTVAAMHVLSVVPNPEKEMAEIARVLKLGGRAGIADHLVRTQGYWRFLTSKKIQYNLTCSMDDCHKLGRVDYPTGNPAQTDRVQATFKTPPRSPCDLVFFERVRVGISRHGDTAFLRDNKPISRPQTRLPFTSEVTSYQIE